MMISFVLPVYNEETNIKGFLGDLTVYCSKLGFEFEFIIVNDGSNDGSHDAIRSLLNKYQCKYIKFSRNFGKEMAINAGLKKVAGDYCVIMDTDYQHPFNMIETLVEEIQSTSANMVYTYIDKRTHESFIKRKLTNFYYFLLNKFSDISIPEGAGDYRILDKKVVDSLVELNESDPYMKGLYSWVGYKVHGIPYLPDARRSGATKYSFGKLFKLAFAGIFSFSSTPLYMSFYLGVIIFVLTFVYSLHIAYLKYTGDIAIPGFATITVLVSMLFGLNFLLLGILGAYVGRINDQIKNRPNYLVEEYYSYES